MDCEICGAKNARKKAEIEGVILTVCDECVKLGKEIQIRKIVKRKRTLPSLPEEIIVSDFSKIIKAEREKRNLTQEQLAKKLKEKVSIIKKIESGWEPSMKLIRKLEKIFNIKLLEKKEEEKIKTKKRKALTIGDIVEVR